MRAFQVTKKLKVDTSRSVLSAGRIFCLTIAHVVSGLFAVPQIFNNKDPIGNGLNDPVGAKPADLQLRAAPRHAADQDVVTNVQLDDPSLRLRVAAVPLLGTFRGGNRRDVMIRCVAGGSQLLPVRLPPLL